MPLLFALYAALAKGINVVGVPLEPAIISASRLVMAVTPALVPIAIYVLAKKAAEDKPYGVNPIANWFLGIKGSLLTSVQQNVTVHYDRVFVLNTLERPDPRLEAGQCRLIQSEDDRYWATRHDIPMGEGAIPDPDYNMFAFYRLQKLPEQWVFDGEGNWTGWGDCSQGSVTSKRENRN